MKTKTYLPIIFSLLTLFNFSCRRDCDRTLEKFSQHEAFHYFAFENQSKWYLSNNDSTITIRSGYVESMDKLHSTNGGCREVIIRTSYDFSFSDSSENNWSIKNRYLFDKREKTTLLSMNQTRISKNSFTYNLGNKEEVFDITDLSYSNENVDLYFMNNLNIKGVNYIDVAVQYYNSTDTLPYVERLYIAPNTGPVKLDMSDGRTFELDSADNNIVNAEYFE